MEVRARVSGYLQSVNFADGAMVKKGDVLFVDRSAALPGRRRPGEGRPRRAPRRGLDLATSQLDRAEALVDRSVVSASSYDERVQTAARGRSRRRSRPTPRCGAVQLNLDFTQVRGADQRARLQPPRRRRQPRHRRSELDAADDDRRARPDLLRLRHERARLPGLPARHRRGDAAVDARPEYGRSRPGCRTSDDWPLFGHDELRRQPGRPRLGHDPGARAVFRNPTTSSSPRPVRPRCACPGRTPTTRSSFPTAPSSPTSRTRS